MSFSSYKRDYLSIVKIRLSYMQIVSFFLLEFLKKLVNLSRRYPCAFNLTYQTDFHPRLWRLPYTKVRASLSIGSRFHSIIVCSWWLFHIWCRVSSQVGVVRISWYQSLGSSGLAYPFILSFVFLLVFHYNIVLKKIIIYSCS